jgi:molybdopterin biosynthesis enzyme
MNPAATLGVYAGALALVFGAAVGVGNAVGPIGTAADDIPAHTTDHTTEQLVKETHGGDHAATSTAAQQPLPGGLAVSQDGYTLQLARTVQTPGRPGRLQFAIAVRTGSASPSSRAPTTRTCT